MAHIVYTTKLCRIEVNLDERDEPAAIQYLLDLVKERTLANLTSAPGVRDVENVYAGSPTGQKPPGFGHLPTVATISPTSGAAAPGPALVTVAAEPAPCSGSAGRDVLRTAPAAAPGGDNSPGAGEPPLSPSRERLLPKTCAWDACSTVFQPYRTTDRYCSKECRLATHVATHTARKAEAKTGPANCPDCPRSFAHDQALAVHRGRTHKGQGPSTEPDATRQPHQRREEPLPERTCALERCGVVFVPGRVDQRFHTRECMKAQLHLDAKAARAGAAPEAHRCTEPGCGATFDNGKALGGHKATHRTKGKAQPARRLPVSPHAVSVGKAEVPAPPLTNGAETVASVTSHDAASAVGKSIPVTPAADRPFACKEPGCGHPCRSQGELASHRRAYHDTKHPMPKVTQVIAALSFPCPEPGCIRAEGGAKGPFDDANKLTHHRRVQHDHQRPNVVHEVVVHGHHGEKVG